MDRTLKHERCVFQLLKKHFSRYDLKTVSMITGTPEADLVRIYDTYSATGKRGMAGTIMYAMGWTQHTTGTQNIRTMAIIQLLLGNMGVAGGGVNALRGESNVQGSTDHCLLWHIWPGYLKTPRASNTTLAAYNEQWTPTSQAPLSANWWQNYPKYSVSMLKSFFGEAADAANDFGYDWLPKVDDGGSYSWFDLFDAMYKQQIKGFFAWGQNPACSGSNAGKIRTAMANLDWMVNVNLFDNETGSFWKGPGLDPASIKTEVFMLPACASMEKEGSITNSGRWMQWRYQGPKPMGNSRADGDIILELGKKIKTLYANDGVFPEPIRNLKWDYAHRRRLRPPYGGQGDQRLFSQGCHHQGQDLQKGHPGAQLRLPAGRRVHLVGQLALLQLLHGKGQHGRPARPQGCRQPHRSLPGVCLVLAGQPAHHLQPGLRGSQGRSLGPQRLGGILQRPGGGRQVYIQQVVGRRA